MDKGITMKPQEGDHQERQAAIETLGAFIRDLRVAMLTTVGTDGVMRSRPMETVLTQFDGDLWFFAAENTGKVDDIQMHAHVNLSFASAEYDRFVSVSGKASLVRDRKKAEALWQDEYLRWIPEGLDDPHLVLLKVSVIEAEYWDARRSTMVSVGEYVKSLFSSRPPESEKHGKIAWNEPAQAVP
jgi:general stress protein 26